MEPQTDYKVRAILYVDDEEKSLTTFERAFGDQFRILTATNARQGLELLRQHRDDVAIVMTDQRMPNEKGIWLLEQARALEPRIIRILVTAYADMETAIAAVNTGAIYKYVSKPWDPPQLETLLKRAFDFHLVQSERDRLLGEKLVMLRNLMVADRVLSLGFLAAGMSHHIRNALVAVKTFLELAPHKLREEVSDPEHLRSPDFWSDYRANALAQVDKINGMLRDLWAASERPACEFGDEVNLAEVVAEVVARMQPLLESRNLAVRMDIPSTLPPQRVDRRKYCRLFELLLEDEAAFLPAGCRIQFSASLEDSPPEGRHLKIEIRDNGPGIPESSLRVIFDPFTVRNDSPSEYGIRLMACFFIVHYHRGRILAQSSEGKGTTFMLKIPLNPANIPDTEENQMFLQKVQLNDEMWGRLLAGS
jgi:two-component system probable response regulator PhcQ